MRPSFKRAAELREANAERNPWRTLLTNLLAKPLPIHRADSLHHTPRDLFEFPKDYALRAYTLHAAAVPLVDATFDEHEYVRSRIISPTTPSRRPTGSSRLPTCVSVCRFTFASTQVRRRVWSACGCGWGQAWRFLSQLGRRHVVCGRWTARPPTRVGDSAIC